MHPESEGYLSLASGNLVKILFSYIRHPVFITLNFSLDLAEMLVIDFNKSNASGVM